MPSSDYSQSDVKRYKTENDDYTTPSQSHGVERLPVSVAELNIKPYKCLRCGFRSDRKSDTLRHIKVKHNFQQPFSLLKILSIKEASNTIEQYERTKASKKVMRNASNAQLNATNTATTAATNTVLKNINNTASTHNNTSNTKKCLPTTLLKPATPTTMLR